MPDGTTQWDFDREKIEQVVGTNQLVLLEALLIAHNWAADAINGKMDRSAAMKSIYDHTDFVLKLVGASVKQAAIDAGQYKE